MTLQPGYSTVNVFTETRDLIDKVHALEKRTRAQIVFDAMIAYTARYEGRVNR